MLQKAFGLLGDRKNLQFRIIVDPAKKVYVDAEYYTVDNSMKFIIRKGQYLENEVFYRDVNQMKSKIMFVQQLAELKKYREIIDRTVKFYKQKLIDKIEKTIRLKSNYVSSQSDSQSDGSDSD